MTSDIRAGIELFLKDKFTPGIKTAGASFKDFGGKALSVADSLNSAFSGLAGTIGTLGVTISAGAMLKSWIDIDARMVRIGADIGATADQTNRLKQRLYEVARDPSIKLGTDQLLEAMDAFAGKNFDADVIKDSLRDIGIVIKATGISGGEAAHFFIESLKRGMRGDEIMRSLDDMSVIGDMLHNQFELSDFTKAFSGLEATNTLLGKSAMNATELFTAMNILASGSRGPARAVASYSAIINELADPQKQELLWNMGIEVREGGIGDFRNLADVLKEIAATSEGTGNFDRLSRVFSTAAMDAIFAYNEFGHLADGIKSLGDTTGDLEREAAANAKSLSSNLQNLQTTFMEMSSDKLTGPLKAVNDILNDISENPERMNAIINKIIELGAALAGIRIGTGLLSFASNFKNVFGGKKTDPLSALGGGSGGAGIPVHVTNWGGAVGTGPGGNTTGSGLLDQFGNPLTNPAKQPAPGLSGSTPAKGGIPVAGAITLGIATAAAIYSLVKNVLAPKLAEADPAVPGMPNYYNMNWGARRKAWAKYEAEHPEEATYDQRTAAGAGNKTTAALRAPHDDGNPSGRGTNRFKRTGDLDMWGERRAVTKEAIPKTLADEINAVPRIPPGGGNPVLEGSARLENYIHLYDDRTEVLSRVKTNTTPIEVDTGSAVTVRRNAL